MKPVIKPVIDNKRPFFDDVRQKFGRSPDLTIEAYVDTKDGMDIVMSGERTDNGKMDPRVLVIIRWFQDVARLVNDMPHDDSKVSIRTNIDKMDVN